MDSSTGLRVFIGFSINVVCCLEYVCVLTSNMRLLRDLRDNGASYGHWKTMAAFYSEVQ